MHVHLLTLGSRGDVQPYVALGATLKTRGHDVTVTTGQGFDDMIEGAGLASASISTDVRAMLDDPAIRSALDTFSGKIRAWRSFKGTIGRQLDETYDRVREVGADVLVFHQKMGVAPTIGAALGVPALASFLIPGMVATSAYPFPLIPAANLGSIGNRLTHGVFHSITDLVYRPMISRWRRETFGKASKTLTPFDGYDPRGRPLLRLHAYSSHILPNPDDWPDRDQITGYWFGSAETDWRPPDVLDRFLDAGSPPVYVGFGSMPTADAGRLTRIVVDALGRADLRGILATVWGGLVKTNVPETVHILETAPHSWLFPRCAAVVHHGGAGTTHEGLRWGRPTIICPVGVDQPFWGRRVAALGVGPEQIPQKRLTTENLAEALVATKDESMIARAEALGGKIRTEGGAETTADLIEAWMAG